MAIQEATVANALSLSNEPPEGPVYISLAITLIDDKITERATLGKFKAKVTFDTRLRPKGIQIKQSDNSWILLNKVTEALSERGYRATQKIRENKSNVTIEVAWD